MWKQLKGVFGKKKLKYQKKDQMQSTSDSKERTLQKLLVLTLTKKNPRRLLKLEWNEISLLNPKAGYQGTSQEEIVDSWFTQLCRGIGAEDEFIT